MKRLLLYSASGAAVLMLSACDGPRYNDNMAATPPVVIQPQGDQFTAAVQNAVAAAPEDAEAISIDAVIVTASEDTEPEAIT